MLSYQLLLLLTDA